MMRRYLLAGLGPILAEGHIGAHREVRSGIPQILAIQARFDSVKPPDVTSEAF